MCWLCPKSEEKDMINACCIPLRKTTSKHWVRTRSILSDSRVVTRGALATQPREMSLVHERTSVSSTRLAGCQNIQCLARCILVQQRADMLKRSGRHPTLHTLAQRMQLAKEISGSVTFHGIDSYLSQQHGPAR